MKQVVTVSLRDFGYYMNGTVEVQLTLPKKLYTLDLFYFSP